MRNFEAHTQVIRRQMLDEINVKNADDLFKMIPDTCKTNLDALGMPLSELDVQKELCKISKKNKIGYISFTGGGAVKKFIPACIEDVAGRFEFLSAYTPYQAEISQGSLQIMYEFQTMMCELTAMDVSNASVYDGATACAEACLMAYRINKIPRIFVSCKMNPNYIEVIKTYLWAQNIECIVAKTPPDIEFSGKIYSFPDFEGELTVPPPKLGRELIIADVDLTVLPCIEPPDADIITGSYQPLGLNVSFGGAHGGFIAAKDIYKRQLPGRIAGKTVDKNGKTAYVLTLQAREQHIKRSKATGNICSNQAHTALCAALYLSLTGENALREYAQISQTYAKKLSLELDKSGYKTINKNFFNTFTVQMKNGISSDDFLKTLKYHNILGGIKIDNHKIVITTTEYNSFNDINLYLNALKNFTGSQ